MSLLQRMLNPVLGIVLGSTLRVLLALLLSVSCYTCIAIALLLFPPLYVVIPLVVLNVTIFLHHWFVMTKREILKHKPRFGSIVDFILTTAECTLVLYFLRPWSLSFDPYEKSTVITLIVAFYVQIVCLCLLWMIRLTVIVTHAIDKPSGVVTKPFDFYAMTNDSNKPSIYRILSGVTISHDRHWFVFNLRRSFTIIIALGLLAFSFTNLVLEPVQETGMTPEKRYTTEVFNPNVTSGNWTIIAFARNYAFGDESKLRDAINVSGMWWDNENVSSNSCVNRTFDRPKRKDYAISYLDEFSAKMVVFDCPFGGAFSDLLITVNFTTLGIDTTFASISSFSAAVSIVVGLHADTLNVLHSTWAIPLVPDAHLLGGVIPTVRQQFKSPGLASLGLFSSKKVFAVCAVPFLSPDPSLQVPRDNNTATLRLYLQDDPSDWHLSVEYREKSVLGGISAVGGFWTVINGLFATIFGTTLLFVLFGSKPLSTFGLIHKIPMFRPVLGDERANGRYRNLLSETESDQGMLDYIRDHFVNLGPFEDDRALNERSSLGTSSPDLTSEKIEEQVSQ